MSLFNQYNSKMIYDLTNTQICMIQMDLITYRPSARPVVEVLWAINNKITLFDYYICVVRQELYSNLICVSLWIKASAK